ncbi:acyl-CoA dehydrogenase family protein [Roseobacter sp.]|uniref:acyl-CoA dehydrogenase family protein n=1 Tax=Roseobacter sp. TaxID=1907202 RepID=UPI00385E6637
MKTIDAVRRIVADEMTTHEVTVEKERRVLDTLLSQVTGKALELGPYACNMTEELGGGSLGPLNIILVEKEPERTTMALADAV